MASFSNVVLVGHLTRDPEIKSAKSGSSFAVISLAINDRRKVGDEWIEEASFVDVLVTGRTAEIAGEYLKKGSMALFHGRLKMDSWEKDGQKFSKLKVIADNMQLLGGDRDKGAAKVKPEKEYRSSSKARSYQSEDVPF
jgi:single-strand DNA-binding protein